jgi:23S rRNA (guanosine2251-2'-O)-methyltransferase
VGASERVACGTVTNLVRALEACRSAGLWIVGAVAQGGEPVDELARGGALPDGLVLVLGSETSGLRRLTRERCDFLATIPRAGRIGSLNVAAAAAVLLAHLTPRPR